VRVSSCIGFRSWAGSDNMRGSRGVGRWKEGRKRRSRRTFHEREMEYSNLWAA
jgi:hypothetical protein